MQQCCKYKRIIVYATLLHKLFFYRFYNCNEEYEKKALPNIIVNSGLDMQSADDRKHSVISDVVFSYFFFANLLGLSKTYSFAILGLCVGCSELKMCMAFSVDKSFRVLISSTFVLCPNVLLLELTLNSFQPIQSNP